MATSNSKVRVRSALLGATLTALAVPGVAEIRLEEILVTARKREVDLQHAPIAVSAVTGAAFEQSNIVRLDNFNGYTPGLTISKNDGAGRVVTIRGVGWETAQNLASQPSVLTYIDGIYLANPLSMGLDLGDLERVEVLRGPQGTEFGQGTTGGSINIVTKKPELEKFHAALEVGAGTYETMKGNGSINIPIGDTVAFRGSVQRYRRDGFSEIEGGAYDGYELDDANSITGKAAMLFQPNEKFSVLVQGIVHDSDQHAAAQKNVDDPNPDERELTQDWPGIFDLQNYSVMAVIEWELPMGVVAKSLTGWQKLEKRQSVDGDRLTEATISIDTLGFFQFNNWDVLPFWDNDSDAVSQEFSFTYDGERLDWVIGGYYLNHENFNDFLEATAPAPITNSIIALRNPSVQTLPPFASALLFNEFRTVTRDDYAAFGQATYQLNDMFAITAGIRYQAEDQRDEGEQFFGIFGGFDRKTDDDKVTWKVGLDVELTENNLLYGLVSTGWKNGGTNPGAITNNALFLEDSFAPEELMAFEIGSRNLFLDGRLRFNVTAFYYDHEHLQFIFEDPVPFGGGTGTVPKVEEYGIETEFSYQFDENWRLDGMFAWQDGKLKSDVFGLDVVDFREALAPGVGLFTGAGFATRLALATSTNLKGNDVPKLVDISARLALTNSHRFGDGSNLTSRAEWVHRGEFSARVFDNPLVDKVPDYDIVNLHFSYALVNMPVTLSLGITNVFDEDGINNIFTNPFGLWTTSNEYVPPREVIGSVRYTWD